MGWSGGSEVAIKIGQAIADNVKSKATRKKLYTAMVDALTEQDWDTLDEASGIDEDLDKILNDNYS